jgi:hypothetical protein
MVSLPVILILSDETELTEVDSNFILGYLATSKKSVDLRCLSLAELEVFTELTSTVPINLAAVGLDLSQDTRGLKLPKYPGTVKPAFLIRNFTEFCAFVFKPIINIVKMSNRFFMKYNLF